MKTQALLFATKQVGLKIKYEKNMCVFVSPEQHSGQNRNVKIAVLL